MEENPGEESTETVGEESDEEALSFSDLPVADCMLEECDYSNGQRPDEVSAASEASMTAWKYVLRACRSTASKPSQNDNFEFSRSNSTSNEQDSAEICPADDLFYKGQLLPLSSSLRCQTREQKEAQGQPFKSCGETVNELSKNYYSRTASLDSQCSSSSSYWGSNAASSQGSQSSRYSDLTDKSGIIYNNGRPLDSQDQNSIRSSKPESIPCEKRCAVINNRPKFLGKSPIKWQFFTLGLIKTPEMRMDDIRLRSSYGASDRSLRSPTPGTQQPGQGIMIESALHLSHKSSAGNPSIIVKKTARQFAKEKGLAAGGSLAIQHRNRNLPSDCKGWRIFRSIVSYRNGCRDSSGVEIVRAGRKSKKCNKISNNNNSMFQDGHTEELSLPFFSDKKNFRDSPRRSSKPPSPDHEEAQLIREHARNVDGPKVELVPNLIRSAVSFCKQCHALEPEIVPSRDIHRLPMRSL